MYTKAAKIIKSSKRCVAFTGAGISVESGIPPFRGENGLWNKYDPQTFDIQYFYSHTQQSWEVIREIFYDLFGKVRPNPAHYALVELEANNMLSSVITQNVDNLHYDAGSKVVHEFHGSLKSLVCLKCKAKYKISQIDLNVLPPVCKKCDGILKPDVIFFGEAIPESASTHSFNEARKADCFILIGTTGTVVPANTIPSIAKSNGAKIIEINPYTSEYTFSVTDIFLEEKASIAMEKLMEEIDKL
ncbi:MAG: NAD-dependent deacylase [Desulfobacula sp.]|uniref:NAD-dependent deacylase n=1 Tax=Desulfobacula sp. TaxID=2593537 RepID=UPI0025C2111C|nr:NAD-dependent deacylase [Desulfobacula sp.]MCD4721754.1 NAD-dependent deacylase [Desulfobacula sp.]